MKQIIRNISTQHLTVFALLLIIALAIWFEGPLLTIANYQPLQDGSKRIILIATLFFLAFFVRWILTPQEIQTLAANLKSNPESKSKLYILTNRFEGAIKFLKKTTIHRHNRQASLASLPWYVMIGPENTGKTTLLANATISYALTKQFKQETITSSDHCDWWATKELVIVDVPGPYLKEKENFLFGSFINLIKKHRGNHGVDAIVVALPLPELMKKQNLAHKKQIVSDIKKTILQLYTHFSDQIPVYFVLTKCDLLPGFLEFFNECSTEELAQAWGITLPDIKENETLYDVFIQRFNALIKKLNTQLLTHLHSERNPNARPAIKDFPLQLERLKETTANFIKALAIPHLHLHGVYLTSATQLTEEAKPAQSQLINPGSQQALQLLRAPIMPSKAFFIRQVILQGLLCSGNKFSSRHEEKWKHRVTYAFSAIIFLASIILLGRDFHHSIFLTYAIQNDLAQYQLSLQQKGQESDHFLKTLPLLNSLKTRVVNTDTKLSQLTHFLSFYSDKSQKSAATVYSQALQTIILPEIKRSLEAQLNNASKIEPLQLYALLKAYLMLGDTQHFQADYVISTLQQFTSHQFDKQTYHDLVMHLTNALHTAPHVPSLNQDLLAQTRSQLMNLPKLDLALVVLKNMNNNGVATASDLIDPSIFETSQLNAIPALFTGAKVPSILTEDIPVAANETLQGNWVLGTADALSNEATLTLFAEQVRARYITTYVTLWENVLMNTKLAVPASLAQTDAMISSITSNTSPLLALLKNIQQNTSFAPILKGSQKLTALNNLLANAHSEQENTLYEIFVSLRKLHFHLEGILNSSDIGHAAFEAAKTRSHNANGDTISMIHLLAQQNTEPMKSWLNNLANQSWYYILDETARYIENEWQLNVVTIYRSQIANHFPMDPNSTQELDMQQFVTFAGKQGTLVNFHDRYLKPFIADETNQWQWRTIDNQKLPFAALALPQIQHALKVQNLSRYALFTQGQRNPTLQRFQLPDKLMTDQA